MNLLQTIEQIAVSLFLPILRANAAHDAGFRTLLSVTVGGELKPLLLVGNAHGLVEDGQCIAVLNPDKSLCDELKACTAYHPANLRETVAKRCDAMVQVWVDAYREVGPVIRSATYKARRPSPAKFAVV